MDHKVNFDAVEQGNIVYVRPVEFDDLPSEVQEQLGEADTLFAVHNAKGERLALVRDRKLAFVLARQHRE